MILPIAQELRRRGVAVTSIVGGRSREWVILETELAAAGVVVPCTDDGSYGRPGFVTEALAEALETGDVAAVYAVGPVPMMRAVAAVTAPLGVPTIVSLNPVMVDGTGMCGGCRVTVDGVTRYACVDGPGVRCGARRLRRARRPTDRPIATSSGTRWLVASHATSAFGSPPRRSHQRLAGAGR